MSPLFEPIARFKLPFLCLYLQCCGVALRLQHVDRARLHCFSPTLRHNVYDCYDASLFRGTIFACCC